MPRNRLSWSRSGIVALAGMAMVATAAFAYDRGPQPARDAVAMAQVDVDPGIDFTITGPAGPSVKSPGLARLAASDDIAKPVRRRMHSN